MYNILRKVLIFSSVILSLVIFVSCDDKASLFDTDRESRLISPEDKEVISGDIEFRYSSYDAKYLILALFSDYPSVNSDNRLTNWEDCIGGIHANMPHFTRGVCRLSSMQFYNAEKNEFNGNGPVILDFNRKYYWCVWGLDEQLRIIESSPVYEFTYVE
ncbi:MAG TPA: hypothetical protein PLA54_11345 [Spirochaetota bacterium]|nr:hypothetical protein [Spirochaetota bacterium]HQE59771.1 hypothetical protein [Spirochaetota bacterium]